MMKKLITFLLSAALMFSLFSVPTLAVNNEEVIVELTTLGILTGDENGELHLEDQLTRAEAAVIVTRFMHKEDMVASYAAKQVFKDVPADHWANGYICMLNSLNIIAGTGDGYFSPDEPLEYDALTKILVCCLGYGVNAEKAGGYPGGYLRVGAEVGLGKGVATSDKFTRQDTARMIYNALYVNIMEEVYADDKTTYRESTSTFRDKFSEDGDGYIAKHKGVVTATLDAYMYSDTDLDDGQIEIDGTVYYTSDPKAQSYLGQTVIYYVDDAVSNKLISITPSTDDTDVVTVDADDVEKITPESVSYYLGTSSKHRNLDSDAIVIYKNRPLADWTSATFENIEVGEVTFINNTAHDDTKINVIIYNPFESAVVEEVNASKNMVYLSDLTMVNGKKYYDFDVDANSDKRLVLYNADGAQIDVSSIEPDNTISITESTDGTFVQGIVSDRYVDGNITFLDDDNVTVNGETYPLEKKSLKGVFNFDTLMRVYINYRGEVAFAKEMTATSDYAYVAGSYNDEMNDFYARLIIPDTLQEKVEKEEDEDGGDDTTVKTLIAKNIGRLDYLYADEVTIVDSTGNSSRVKASEAATRLKDKVVRYKINNDNKLYYVTVLSTVNAGTRRVYNSSERTFGKGNGSDSESAGGGFGVDFNTYTLCIPDADAPDFMDYCTDVEMSNGKTYNIKCYAISSTRFTADLVLINSTMHYGTVAELTDSSKVGFVTKGETIMNEETGLRDYRITMLAEGKEKTYFFSDAYRDSEYYEEPSEGCLVAYILDNDGLIQNLKIVKGYSKEPKIGLFDTDAAYTIFTGYATDAKYNYVSNTYNRWVTRFEVGYEPTVGEGIYYNVYKKNTPPIFVYDKNKQTTEYGDVRTIAVQSDMVSFFISNNKIRAIVVRRD